MQNNLIHRIVIVIALAISIIFLMVQMSMGYDFLEATYNAACVMLSVSIILLIALQSMVKILFSHLSDRQKGAQMTGDGILPNHSVTNGDNLNYQNKGNGQI